MIFADSNEKTFTEISDIRYPLANPIQDFTSWNARGHAALTRATSQLINGLIVDQFYKENPWVLTCINELVNPMISVPLKVVERVDSHPEIVEGSRYGALLDKPSATCDPVEFWQWIYSTYHLYGGAAAFKVRDAQGMPISLERIHPSRITYEKVDGSVKWYIVGNNGDLQEVDRADLWMVRRYNPDTTLEGFSWLQPLIKTIENDKKARLANSAMWTNGGKPAFVLKHPKILGAGNPNAVQALADQFQLKHGGVENWGRPLVLEEGMEAVPLKIEQDLHYLDARRFNRSEIIAASGLPQTAAGVLDHSTYSNVSEMNRSLYARTMPPHFRRLESSFDFNIRDGYGAEIPDFKPNQKSKFILEGVLRGDFQTRTDHLTRRVQSGLLTPNEARAIEDRPPVEGGDRLLINQALAEVESVGRVEPPDSSNARHLSSVMGQLSRVRTPADIDLNRIAETTDMQTAETVRMMIDRYPDLDMKQFRLVLKSALTGENQ